ncbi:MAG TPA: hypothetical protein VMV04_22030 [Thermodesulfobacteriota bacterium]|jgi:maleate cis-trans isomerase|nr:hypothetical protein [Thermodesulfobacteriota bacterium]
MARRSFLKACLEKGPKVIPVLTTGVAAVAAFRALAVRRIALIDLPWFSDDVVEKRSACSALA